MAKMPLMTKIEEFFSVAVWLIGSKNWFLFIGIKDHVYSFSFLLLFPNRCRFKPFDSFVRPSFKCSLFVSNVSIEETLRD